MVAPSACRTGEIVRARRRRGRFALRVLPGVALLFLVASCAGSPSALDPAGPRSADVANAWWVLFAVASAVCLLVILMAVFAVIVRRRARKVSTTEGKGFVLALGVLFPAVVLAATFALSLVELRAASAPATRPRVTIQVTGHDWWWGVRYAGTSAVTANEIHVPVGQPVRLRLRTADVIHSFWVPQLMPKTDLLPRRVNEAWFTADHAGTYRGQCAEFCGLEHAHMAFLVIAQPPARFRAWLARESRPAGTPASALAQRGEQVVTTSTCATCHTVRGTSADGHVGPDLTHVGSRTMLAAGTIPNDVGHMSGWIANSQAIKPGNKMPPQRLSPQDLHAVVAYLQGLE